MPMAKAPPGYRAIHSRDDRDGTLSSRLFRLFGDVATLRYTKADTPPLSYCSYSTTVVSLVRLPRTQHLFDGFHVREYGHNWFDLGY